MDKKLILSGHATDHIWAMQHDDDLYGLRVDCGDAGTLYMNKAQAQEIIETLQLILSEEGIIRNAACNVANMSQLSRKFKDLVQEWRNERGSMSSIEGMSMLPAYQNIISMGLDALPLILAELRAEGDDPDQWFWALMSISEANDLKPPQMKLGDQGNFKKMADIWLAWSESQSVTKVTEGWNPKGPSFF